MSVVEQWAVSAPSNGGEEHPGSASTGGPGRPKMQLLKALVLDSPPPGAIAAAKLLFAMKTVSEGDATL